MRPMRPVRPMHHMRPMRPMHPMQGESVDRALLASLARMFGNLGTYETALQCPLLERSQAWYQQVSVVEMHFIYGFGRLCLSCLLNPVT